MTVWILNHYATTPDQPMAGPFDLAKVLVGKGHEVIIFASSFSHYQLRELRLGSEETWRMEQHRGVKIIWIKTTPYSKNDWHRILNMFSYGWRAFWIGLRLAEKPDVIIGVTVHPLAVLSAYLLSLFRKAGFVFEVRDLWPLTLIQFGRLSENSPVAWAMRILEKFLFRRAEKIIMVWPKMDDYGASLGIPRDKFVWIPQGIDLSRYEHLQPYDGKKPGPFTLMYLGGHVKANALDVVLRAAHILQSHGHQNVRFVFVGGGQEKAKLVQLSKDLRLRNVEFRNVVARSELPKVMDEADGFVFCLQNLSLYKYGISFNKMYDYLMSGRPILFAGNAGFNPVTEAGAGRVVAPEDPVALARAIEGLVAMPPEERVSMGKKGRLYVEKHNDIRLLAARLEEVLKAVVGARKSLRVKGEIQCPR